MKYYITHFKPIDYIYIPHYASIIKTERESIDSLWRTEIEVDEDYAEVAEDWMYYTDSIIEYAELFE